MSHASDLHEPWPGPQPMCRRPGTLGHGAPRQADLPGVLPGVPALLRRTLPGVAAASLLVIAAGCAPRVEPGAGEGPGASAADVRVVERARDGSGLQQFDVRRDGRLFRVDVLTLGGGFRRVVVTQRSSRGMQRGDAQLAYEAAHAASLQVDCGGRPLAILPETATFQEEDRSTVLVKGAPAYVFEGRCA